jgi:hypothetical protein
MTRQINENSQKEKYANRRSCQKVDVKVGIFFYLILIDISITLLLGLYLYPSLKSYSQIRLGHN